MEATQTIACQQFALCLNDATALVHHPIIGSVPSCADCIAALDQGADVLRGAPLTAWLEAWCVWTLNDDPNDGFILVTEDHDDEVSRKMPSQEIADSAARAHNRLIGREAHTDASTKRY